MCGRYGNQVGYHDYFEALKDFGLRLVSPAPEKAPNLEPNADIRPSNVAPVLRAIEGGVELARLRWGLIPHFYKGAMREWKATTFNARVENLATTPTYKKAFQSRRCIVPATNFYEWTGAPGHKTKWSFCPAGGGWFGMAGLWDHADTEDGPVETYTIVTCDAGPDVKPYHARQPLILDPENYRIWLDPARIPALPLPMQARGFLTVGRA